MTFSELNIIMPILEALKEEGYSTPTPIQQKAIPPVLAGRDLLGCAQTGTGKTAAFAIPVLQLLSAKKTNPSNTKKIRTLILTPTRELALQIHESFNAYGRKLPLTHQVLFGGVNQHSQVNGLKRGTDVLVATPGRLLDLMNQGFVHLNGLEILILDEADRMLDMGFIHDVKKIIAAVPKQRQTLFFSATMPDEIRKLANGILHDPVHVSVAPVSSTADTIVQHLYYVDKDDKRALLLHLLKSADIQHTLVFTRTKHGANKVVKDLMAKGIKADAIHGNKSQVARQQALTNFKNKSLRVLVATDIAARGIDVDDLKYVINYDLPEVSETYVHRIGRTGRAGNAGTSFSFCEHDDTTALRDIERLISKRIPLVTDHPFHVEFDGLSKRMPRQQGQRPPQQRSDVSRQKPSAPARGKKNPFSGGRKRINQAG
ncbi:MAG: DEAD/DEAH box helicase [Saprospiraceae bacterium]|nr:DEAD/DEAH box helicase [Saprospiraceae bacterium]